MDHEQPQTLGLMGSVHWSAILSLVLSLFVALVSALWWWGWLHWTPGFLGQLVWLLGFVVIFGPFVAILFAIFATVVASYQAWRFGWRESLFLAIPALLIALLTLKGLVDHWPGN